MPRPQPIIVPSSGTLGGMSGKQRDTQVNIDLGRIIDFFRQKKERTSAEERIKSVFGEEALPENTDDKTLAALLGEANKETMARCVGNEYRNALMRRNTKIEDTSGETPVEPMTPKQSLLTMLTGGQPTVGQSSGKVTPPPQEKQKAWEEAVRTEAGRKSLEGELYPEQPKAGTPPTTMEGVLAGRVARGEMPWEEASSELKKMKEKEEQDKDKFYSMDTEETAQRLFETPYARLTQEQRNTVFKEQERAGEAQSRKTGGGGKDELDIRKGIETILGKEMSSKFGGVKYDMINEQFVFPEKGIDQPAFWAEYTRRKRAYLKKYDMEEVLPESTEPSKDWKKYLGQK